MPTRVLQIIGQIAVGGAERQLLGLCRRIDQSRFPTAVCYYAPNPDNMVEEFRSTGVQLHFIDKVNMSALRFLREMRRVVRTFGPDIIHTWQFSPNWWGRLAGWTCGCRRFIASERTTRLLYGAGCRWLERLVGKRTIWTANSGAVAQSLTKSLGIALDSIRIIYNAVELPKRNRKADRAAIHRELDLTTDQPIVLSVGRLTQAKNYPMLFRAAKRVLAARPEVCFVVAGHGELERKLLRLHDRFGLAQGLRILGLRHDVSRLMNAADVFCLCSQWEGFPNVLIEAMASSLPVVTTAFPGVGEFFLPDQTGLLVDVDDDRNLAAAIERLLDNRELAGRLGHAARERVENRFSRSKLVCNIQALYDDCMNSG